MLLCHASARGKKKRRVRGAVHRWPQRSWSTQEWIRWPQHYRPWFLVTLTSLKSEAFVCHRGKGCFKSFFQVPDLYKWRKVRPRKGRRKDWLKISQQQRTELVLEYVWIGLLTYIIFQWHSSLVSISGNRHQVGVDLFGIKLFQLQQTHIC